MHEGRRRPGAEPSDVPLGTDAVARAPAGARALRRAVTLTVVVAALAGWPGPARADHRVGHLEPLGPAPARFPDGFTTPTDAEWGFPLGGFGGVLDDDADWGVVAAATPRTHPPVIFVHGNTTDAADWYPVRDAFIAAGWDPAGLWAVSYNGLGSQSGTDGTANPRRDAEHLGVPGYDFRAPVTDNERNVADVAAFIDAVRNHTRSQRFIVVAHSLGVTVVRRTLQVHPRLRADLVAFVAIAGANHGTSLCPPGSEGVVMSCDEIAAGTPWLAELNGPDGADETYAPARWLVVRDGTGTRDVAFLGPYADSPLLAGAEDLVLADQHNDVRIAPTSIDAYRRWLEGVLAATSPVPPPGEADGGTPVAPSGPTAGPQSPGEPLGTLPATGGGAVAVVIAAVSAGTAVLLRRWAGRSPVPPAG